MNAMAMRTRTQPAGFNISKYINMALFHCILIMLIYMLLTLNMAQNSQMALRTTAWNMNCMYNSAGPYLSELMNKTDVMVITEH